MLTKLEDISKETLQRYSERYKKLGYDVQTLGWGTKEQQDYRFFQTLDANVNFDNKTVLDIGCGFGDYYNFFRRTNVPIAHYIGWDINPDLINEADRLHNADKNVTFGVKNIIESAEDTPFVADIGVILGVLNFNLKDKFDNYDYSKLVIQKAFCLVKDVGYLPNTLPCQLTCSCHPCCCLIV